MARGQTGSVAMLDADHFKRVNDSFGHLVGDWVLCAIVSIVTRELRGADMLARIGGEEFLLRLPITDREQAIEASERVRKVVEEHPWESLVPGLAVTITISIGVSELDRASNPSRVLAAAAARLYEAKHAGRNRVCG